MILGFDPGRDKCGVAILAVNVDEGDQTDELRIQYHQVIPASEAIATIAELVTKFPVDSIVMGNLTTSQTWYRQLNSAFADLKIAMVDENNSTLEARDRYWQMYPPQGLQKLIPRGLLVPPRPIDDIVAILLIERYLNRI